MLISLRNNGATGEKMWEAEVTPKGVTIRFGKVGKKPRTQSIPLSACVNQNAVDEALSRAGRKRNEGYWDIDPVIPKPNRNEQAKPPTEVSLGVIAPREWF